jgi:hypothetical protein
VDCGRTREKGCLNEERNRHRYFDLRGYFNVRFILSLVVGGLLAASVNTVVSLMPVRVGLYALVGTLAGAVASGMLLWVLLLL